MIKPNLIESGRHSSKKGLYESFYFRGNSLQSGQSFWLKHNLLIFKKSLSAQVESILIFFDKDSKAINIYKLETEISLDQLELVKSQAKNSWEDISFKFPNESFFKIEKNKLQGKLITEIGTVSWDFDLTKSNINYFHFPKDKYYRWPFPKKKIITNDIDVLFSGKIVINDQTFSDNFKGMNGHNWGTEHAYLYQYANCNQFMNGEDAFFDGFSAKILLGKIIKSPYLSSCGLKIGKDWFYFNDMMALWKHDLKELKEKSWAVTFENEKYLLSVEISDEKHDWAHLNYHHPDHKVSVINNTKFASGTLRLVSKNDCTIVKELKSDFFELESLIP